MIAADTNIFLYAYDPGSEHHAAAVRFFEMHAKNKQFALCGLILVEVYMQLRNPAVAEKPLSAGDAADFCKRLMAHNYWPCVDYEPVLLARLWEDAENKNRGFRHIIDARIALTLRHHGVTDFATANVRDFENFGFRRVWNPLEEI